jgi:hypothetical protein
MFRLTIDTGNAAFAGDPLPELARLMGVVSAKLADGRHQGNLLDINGNAVGQFTFEPDEDEDSETAARNLLDEVIADLDDSYELISVAYDDTLIDAQIRVLFEGACLDDDPAFDDWRSEAENEGAMYVMEDLLDDEQRDLLARHDLLDELRFAIQDRNTVDIAHELIARTPHKWMRYAVDFDAESIWSTEEAERDAELVEIAAAVGIDFDTYRTNLREMSENASEGGRLHILWCGDIEPLVDAAGRTITWTDDPSLLIFSTMGGSGWMCELPGATITLPWNRDNLRLDTGDGSWSEWVCGGLYARTDTTVTITGGESK